MSVDWTVLGTALVTGGVALAGSRLQAKGLERQIDAETRRHQLSLEATGPEARRQVVYQQLLDQLSTFYWDVTTGRATDKSLGDFTMGFVHASNNAQLYASQPVIEAISGVQSVLSEFNAVMNRNANIPSWWPGDRRRLAAACYEAYAAVEDKFAGALDSLFRSMRADVMGESTGTHSNQDQPISPP